LFLQSTLNGRFYVDSSDNPDRRLLEHNAGNTKSTKPYRPWKIVYQHQFSEINGGKAYLAGVQANLSARVALSVFYRNYGIEYQNIYSNALGENSSNQTEKGLYAGILLRLHKNWTFNGYADQFAFPWLSYRKDAPARGSEYLGQLN